MFELSQYSTEGDILSSNQSNIFSSNSGNSSVSSTNATNAMMNSYAVTQINKLCRLFLKALRENRLLKLAVPNKSSMKYCGDIEVDESVRRDDISIKQKRMVQNKRGKKSLLIFTLHFPPPPPPLFSHFLFICFFLHILLLKNAYIGSHIYSWICSTFCHSCACQGTRVGTQNFITERHLLHLKAFVYQSARV